MYKEAIKLENGNDISKETDLKGKNVLEKEVMYIKTIEIENCEK